MEIEQCIGWAAVATLFFTLSGQAWKQWKDRVKRGIGKYFFAGQIAASLLFLAYSAMTGDRVFVVGNALVLCAAMAGGGILWYNRARR
jgi:uncharacterized protein with PQ loop repeat